jgi:hypothetical protein
MHSPLGIGHDMDLMADQADVVANNFNAFTWSPLLPAQ